MKSCKLRIPGSVEYLTPSVFLHWKTLSPASITTSVYCPAMSPNSDVVKTLLHENDCDILEKSNSGANFVCPDMRKEMRIKSNFPC